MEKENTHKEEGLIPKIFKKWMFKKQFTRAEWEEVERIKREAFMKKMREQAKKDGERLVKEYVKNE